MEEFSERGLEVTVLSAVDLATQLTKQRDLDRLRPRLRHVWRRMLTSSQLCFTGDVLRQASRPGVRPATDLTDALDHLARESTRREVDDAVAACLGTTRSQLTVREESVYRGTDRSAVEVIEIGDPAVDLTADVVLDVFARVVAVDPPPRLHPSQAPRLPHRRRVGPAACTTAGGTTRTPRNRSTSPNPPLSTLPGLPPASRSSAAAQTVETSAA